MLYEGNCIAMWKQLLSFDNSMKNVTEGMELLILASTPQQNRVKAVTQSKSLGDNPESEKSEEMSLRVQKGQEERGKDWCLQEPC